MSGETQTTTDNGDNNQDQNTQQMKQDEPNERSNEQTNTPGQSTSSARISSIPMETKHDDTLPEVIYGSTSQTPENTTPRTNVDKMVNQTEPNSSQT